VHTSERGTKKKVDSGDDWLGKVERFWEIVLSFLEVVPPRSLLPGATHSWHPPKQLL
jgi:hypothetical protein